MKFFVHRTSYSDHIAATDKEFAIRKQDDDGKFYIWNHDRRSGPQKWHLHDGLPNEKRFVGVFDTFEEALIHCLGVPELYKFASRFV